MIVSFSGAQSTGKSTLLNHLQPLNADIKFVPEVTRLVKREYNLPINEDGTDVTQMMIMSEHLRNAYNREYSESNVIMDRCSLDGIVYTHWLCDNSGLNMQTYTFAQNVFSKTLEKYDIIFYTSPDDVLLEDDGERSANVKFRTEIIKLFADYMSSLSKIDSDKVVILKGSVQDRLITIKNTLKLHNISINI
jgi:nicotinamide riboside kinase